MENDSIEGIESDAKQAFRLFLVATTRLEGH